MDQTESGSKSGLGLTIAIILIIAVLVVGAVYFSRGASQIPGDDTSGVVGTPEADSASAIEADLNSTNVDEVDQTLDGASVNAS